MELWRIAVKQLFTQKIRFFNFIYLFQGLACALVKARYLIFLFIKYFKSSTDQTLQHFLYIALEKGINMSVYEWDDKLKGSLTPCSKFSPGFFLNKKVVRAIAIHNQVEIPILKNPSLNLGSLLCRKVVFVEWAFVKTVYSDMFTKHKVFQCRGVNSVSNKLFTRTICQEAAVERTGSYITDTRENVPALWPKLKFEFYGHGGWWNLF